MVNKSKKAREKRIKIQQQLEKDEKEIKKLIIFAKDIKQKMKITHSQLEKIEEQILKSKQKNRTYSIVHTILQNMTLELTIALSEIKTMDYNKLLEISTYSNPSETCKMVLEAIFLLLKGKILTFEKIKSEMQDGFIEEILHFNINNVDEEIIEKLDKEYIQNENWDIIKIVHASKALGPLANWLTNLLDYKKRLKKKKPLVKELDKYKKGRETLRMELNKEEVFLNDKLEKEIYENNLMEYKIGDLENRILKNRRTLEDLDDLEEQRKEVFKGNRNFMVFGKEKKKDYDVKSFKNYFFRYKKKNNLKKIANFCLIHKKIDKQLENLDNYFFIHKKQRKLLMNNLEEQKKESFKEKLEKIKIYIENSKIIWNEKETTNDIYHEKLKEIFTIIEKKEKTEKIQKIETKEKIIITNEITNWIREEKIIEKKEYERILEIIEHYIEIEKIEYKEIDTKPFIDIIKKLMKDIKKKNLKIFDLKKKMEKNKIIEEINFKNKNSISYLQNKNSNSISYLQNKNIIKLRTDVIRAKKSRILKNQSYYNLKNFSKNKIKRIEKKNGFENNDGYVKKDKLRKSVLNKYNINLEDYKYSRDLRKKSVLKFEKSIEIDPRIRNKGIL